MTKVIQIILLILLCNSFLNSQIVRPRNKAQVDFHVSISQYLSSSFLYTYTISNKESSQEACDNFRLIVTDSLVTNNITRITGPTNKKWYIDGRKNEFISGSPANRFFNFPVAPKDALFPGELIFISFSSPGLPSIMTYYAQSFALPLNEDEMDSLHELGYTDKQILPKWEDNSYKNLTVAPNTSLLKLLPLTFLDTLISYTTQSRTLGWITNQATADKYFNWLATTKTLLQAGHNNSARDTLQTIIANTISDSTNNIASEAYALLRFNTEYLLHKIPIQQ